MTLAFYVVLTIIFPFYFIYTSQLMTSFYILIVFLSVALNFNMKVETKATIIREFDWCVKKLEEFKHKILG